MLVAGSGGWYNKNAAASISTSLSTASGFQRPPTGSSHSPPETQHLCWVMVPHVVAQYTTVADDIAACKENLNAMVKT